MADVPPASSVPSSSIPLSAAPVGGGDPSSLPPFSLASLHRHCARLGAEISARLDAPRRSLLRAAAAGFRPPPLPLFASSTQRHAAAAAAGRHAFDVALSAGDVAKTLAGTRVYTVSNANNEFVLISDPINGLKSLGLLCFRQEDAQSLLVQVYMLKVEGIAFRFLPDPLQIKNALELKSVDRSRGFDGVPVFQSELLVIKKKNKRYCPIYFQKVGSLEDVLKKMEMNDKNSGWEDLIFIPPGKSLSEHINEVAA